MSGLHVDFQISFLSFENLVFAKCLRLTLPVKVCNVSPKLTKLARGSWELKPKQAGQSVGFAQKHILPLAAAVAQSASNAASSLAVCLGGPIPLPSLSSLPVSLSVVPFRDHLGTDTERRDGRKRPHGSQPISLPSAPHNPPAQNMLFR